jgi:hypothetical protein
MNDRLFNNDYLYNLIALQQLREQQSPLEQLLRNLQVNGQAGSIDGRDVSGYSYGGRIGSALPIGPGMFRAGIQGQGYNVDTPMGRMSDRGITGGDIGYSWGDKDLGLSYNTMPEQGGSPLLQLLFKKYFD